MMYEDKECQIDGMYGCFIQNTCNMTEQEEVLYLPHVKILVIICNSQKIEICLTNFDRVIVSCV